MADYTSFAYNSFIKNIYLEIPEGYKYRHHSSSPGLYNEPDAPFLGRKEILDSFVDILDNGGKQGVYLVTGYRGMGKTSFVNKSIKRIREEREKDELKLKINEVRLSLAQSELKDVDILKNIVGRLLEDIRSSASYRYIHWTSLKNIFSWLWPLISIFLILINLFTLLKQKENDNTETLIENLLGIITLSALITLLIYNAVSWFYSKYVITNDLGRSRFYQILTYLFLFFISSSLLDYVCVQIWAGLNFIVLPVLSLLICIIAVVLSIDIITKKFPKPEKPIKPIYEQLLLLHKRCHAQVTSEDQFRETFSTSVFSIFRKDVALYPIANPREIEAELIKILEGLSQHSQYIFIFDELDKVDPNLAQITSTQQGNAGERTYLDDLQERRRLITNILGSLKYFISEAHAKFIFIAGREMFEAALADISDRQSSISSIFHHVIYVDSFLKDKSEGETRASGIGVSVERHLINILLPSSRRENAIDFFTAYYAYLTEESDGKTILTKEEARKIIFVLQNFLGYLVYRSNGSPKKIIKLLEEYIVTKALASQKRREDKDIVFNVSNTTSHYLRFSYIDQYKLGFTAYLFQPFLTMYSSFMKRYSDSTLVSTPYLIDNLIKFHPFAFSAQNLELIPEILSTNKTPISRPFLEELITFLGQNHIRRTESGLFEYKFYDRTHNEITFISKLFEDEAAAFNFTLDENFSIKAHLIAKIQQLRETHRGRSESDPQTENPYGSIIFLNRLLGDVRFQDEEYEDAIISYQDAVQMLYYERLKYANAFVTFIRLKLKLGLTYEKIKAYEFALGHYAGVIEEGSDYLMANADKHSVIYREFLLLIMQAYSATLYLQEKLQEGITFQKTRHLVQGFEKLMNLFPLDYDNRDILRATFYSNIGTALYYKNIVLPQKVNEARINSRKSLLGLGRKQAQTKTLNCFPNAIHADFILVSEKEIASIDDMSRIHEDARLSFTTYIYYKRTLQALLGYEANDLIGCLQASTELIYVDVTRNDATYRSLQHIRRLVGLGQALAKLGDFLLPAVVVRTRSDSPDAEVNCINVTEALGYFYTSATDAPKESDARKKLLAHYFKNEAKSDLKGKVHPRLIVHIFYLSSLFYQNASETANAAFQLRKILFVLRSLDLVVPRTSKITVFEALSCLEENLLKRILELSSWMSHSSDRPQLSKTKKYFDINTLRTPHADSSELYGNLSNNPDTKETILAYALLRMRYAPNKLAPSLWASFKLFPEHRLLSPYGSIAHHIIRVMEHQLHTHMNFRLLKTYIENQFSVIAENICRIENQKGSPTNFLSICKSKEKSWISSYFHACKLYDVDQSKWHKPDEHLKPTEKEFDTILKRLDTVYKPSVGKSIPSDLQEWVQDYSAVVINSIFNLCQIDRIINTYGINYILSYSFMGQIHHYLGTWIKHLHLCRILNKRYSLEIAIDDMLNNLVGPQFTTTLDTLTSYQVAIQYYYQAIQLHKEGNPYRHQINNMIYLEDDYNDNLYHFGAALERLRINSGSIRNHIDQLKNELDTANMYKYSTYIGDEELRRYPVNR